MTPEEVTKARLAYRAAKGGVFYVAFQEAIGYIPALCDEVERLTAERADAVRLLGEVTGERDQARSALHRALAHAKDLAEGAHDDPIVISLAREFVALLDGSRT